MAKGVRARIHIYDHFEELKLSLRLTKKQRKEIEEVYGFDLSNGGEYPLSENVFVSLVQDVKTKEKEMSTNDVPGHRPENADQLAMGSWAEHEDGSLIFVQSVENKRVIYMLFDMRRMPPRRWQGAMDETKFKQHFSWDPKKAKKDPTHFKWTWHDKKPFPWDNVMEEIDEEPLVQTEDEIKSAAERVAEALGLRAEAVRRADIEHRAEQVRPGTAAGTEIMQRLRRALDAFFEEPR